MNRKNKVLLFAVIITTIIITTFALSKYKSTMFSKSSASPAIPVISLISNTLNVDLKINPVNKEQDYIFKVSNYESNDKVLTAGTTSSEIISEVAMKYVLQLKTLNILPLKFELYNYDEDNKIISGENLLTDNKTKSVVMDFNKKEVQTYMLKVKWKDGNDNYLYSKEIDCVQLVLNSEQVD